MSVTAMKGTAVSQPGVETYRVTSLCAMPRTRPATVVMGKELNPPITAAARIGMTMKLRFSAERVVMGTRRMAASPPRAAPMAQLAAATRSGEMARVAAAVGFSATADVANPNLVYL